MDSAAASSHQACNRLGRASAAPARRCAGRWDSSPRAKASPTACRRSSLRCIALSGRAWRFFRSSRPTASAISAASAGNAASRSRSPAGCRSRCSAISATCYVPLGHGALIQPSCAALGGLLLARFLLKEPLPPRRIAGAVTILAGLARDRRRGAAAPWARAACSAICCSSPPAPALRSSACCCGCGLFRRCARSRSPACCRSPACRCCCSASTIWWRPGLPKICCRPWCRARSPAPAPSICSPARSCCSGASRAVLFPSLVPPFTLLVGYLALGEVPSVSQLIGLVIVVVGFRLTQRN